MAISRTLFPCIPISPYPIMVVPGSMPKMIFSSIISAQGSNSRVVAKNKTEPPKLLIQVCCSRAPSVSSQLSMVDLLSVLN